MAEHYIAIENGEETPIASMYNLRRELTFLFRTGDNNEHVNDYTPLNWVTFPEFDEETFNMGELESREQLRDICMEAIEGVLVGEDEDAELTDDVLENYLYKFTVAWVNEDGEPVSDESFGTDERDFIVYHFRKNPNTLLISLVCHKDINNGERLHGLFIWLPGKLNRIESILMPPEDYEDELNEGEQDGEAETEINTQKTDEKLKSEPENENTDKQTGTKEKEENKNMNVSNTSDEIKAKWAEKLKFEPENESEPDSKNNKNNGAGNKQKEEHKSKESTRQK